MKRTSALANHLRQDPSQALLHEALSGPSARWVSAALDQAGDGEEVLLAAIDAAVLASELARRAVGFLQAQSLLRMAAEGALS